MIERPGERRMPLPPALSRRAGLLGALAFVLFAVIVFRLWYLQVLTGAKNTALATANVTRTLPIAAPRGNIVDSSGRVLASTRQAVAVEIVKSALPGGQAFFARLAAQHGSLRAAEREVSRRWHALFLALDHVIGVPLATIERDVASGAVPIYQPVLIKADVGSYALDYLSERKRFFPGVIEEAVYVRSYPHHGDAAQAIGTVYAISPSELSSSGYPRAKPGDIVGQSGLEQTYDSYLRGTDGSQQVQVAASGYPTGKVTTTAPTQGDVLRTSIDLALEQEGMRALATGESLARANHKNPTGAAFIAMNPNSGEVYATGSIPTFDPNWFATGLSTAQASFLSTSVEGAAGPEYDRVTSGLYPTGSTFKPIAALAGLEAGAITPSTLQGAGSCVVYSGQPFCNSGGANYGDNDLVNALRVSEDTYFYRLGAATNDNGVGGPIQRVARELGLGSLNPVDFAPNAQSAGVVPDRAWVDRENRLILARYCRHGHTPAAAFALACSLGYYYNAWTVGQNVQLATGQGYLEATPMQMAVAYSALANGGTVVTPHIGLQIENAQGGLIAQLPAPAKRHVVIDPLYRETIMTGLHLAAQGTGGTSDDVFGNFPRTVYGKTGTAEVKTTHGTVDQSWYVAYVPDTADPSRSIVVAVTVEGGGFGDEAAAPAARQILARWFGLPTTVVRGTSTTR